MSCSSCCGTSGNNGDGTTVVVAQCCGLPEPAAGWSGTHFMGVLKLADLTTATKLELWDMVNGGTALAAPSAAQRIYIFGWTVSVGVAGYFELYEDDDAGAGAGSPPGTYANIFSGSLAQNGGGIHKVPNRPLRLGNRLWAKHSAIGQVDVIVQGRLVTEA